MNVPFLDLKPGFNSLRAELDASVARVFDQCNFVLGEPVSDFEKAVCAWCGAPHAVAVASGTDALKIALQALGAGPETAVITSPVTFVATSEAVLFTGALPLFCDVDAATSNLDPARVRELLERDCDRDADGHAVHRASGRRVTGLLPVHLYGQCADMAALMGIAGEYGLFVLEDAAQAFGAQAEVGGQYRHAGTMGDAGAISFYPSKNLGGAGDGGLITTKRDDVAEQCRVLRVHGAPRAYEYVAHGFNSRLDTLQAVVLNVKLPHLENWITARRERAAFYTDRFKEAGAAREFHVCHAADLDGPDLPDGPCLVLPSEAPGRRHTFNSFNVRVHGRDELQAFLRDNQVGTNIYYPIPLHVQKVYEDLAMPAGGLPVAEAICSSVIALPMFPEISEQQQQYVVDKVSEFLSR